MTHSDIIDKWPSLAEFARDLSVPYGTAKAMRRRGSIPAIYWKATVASALRRSINGIGLQELADAIAAPSLDEPVKNLDHEVAQ